MTRDDAAGRRDDAQHVVDALTELFDALPPSDRAAAEEELREAGADPAAVGARIEDVAARTLSPHSAAERPTRLRSGDRTVDPARRGTAAQRDGGVVGPNRPRSRRQMLRAAVLLGVGCAVGWTLARGFVQRSGDTGARSDGIAAAPAWRDDSASSRRLPERPADKQQRPPAQKRADVESANAAPQDAAPTGRPTPEAERRGDQPAEMAPHDPLPGEPAAAVDSEIHAGTVVTRTAGESWILDSNTWQQADGMLPPVVLERVKRGDYWYKVVAVDPEEFKRNYSDKFWAASAANAGRYDVDPETCGLKDVATGKMPDFYFGYPFPKIDPKDPLAACKMAWNFEAANSMGEGQGATFTLNGIDAGGEFKRVKLWLHTMAFLGRHGGPIDNPEHLRATSLANVLEPQDIDAVGGLTRRENNWNAQDQVWFYVPATRRVRRVNAATRSDPVAGLDIFADDLNCYGGKIEYYRWKLVGEQNILAPLLGPAPLAQNKTSSPTRFTVDIPYAKGVYETPGARGVPWLVVNNLVMVPRPVWVIEGESNDPYYNFGKVIMYVDRDMYRIYWKLVHNRAGEYFYNAMCAYHWSKSDDGAFSAVTQNLVVGVNDLTSRACLAGRYTSQFIERQFPDDYFTLRSLTHISD